MEKREVKKKQRKKEAENKEYNCEGEKPNIYIILRSAHFS